jgi:hypothetical protein
LLKEITMKPLVRVLFAAFLGLLMVAAQTIPVKAEETAYTPAEEDPGRKGAMTCRP